MAGFTKPENRKPGGRQVDSVSLVITLFLLFFMLLPCAAALTGCEVGRDLQENGGDDYQKYEAFPPQSCRRCALPPTGARRWIPRQNTA